MKKIISTITVICCITFSGLFISCKDDDEPVAPLYERIGGEPVVTGIIDQTITNIITDNRINFFFAALATDQSRAFALRKNLIDQLGELSGGDVNYTGRNMVTVHTGFSISDAQFDAFIEDFSNAVSSKGIPADQKAELVGLYVNLKLQITNK